MTLSEVAAKPRQLTEVELCTWLGEALPGAKLVYYRGYLAVDCNSATSPLAAEDRAELARVARRARIAEEMGLVHLIQRRHGPTDYSYIIITRVRSKPPRTPARIRMVQADDTPVRA
jgi:hypothetical protein